MKQIRWIWSLTKKKRGMILGLLVLVSVIAVFQVCLAVAVQLIVDKAQGKGAAPSFLPDDGGGAYRPCQYAAGWD